MPRAGGQGDERFDLQRFEAAQKETYACALAELRRGAKTSHWMWFIFPQFKGLGSSERAAHFAIGSLDEARAYLAHPVLGPRLVECCEALMMWTHRSASEILGYPDDLKLRSSMTLFELVDRAGGTFSRVLDAFFEGQRDDRTLRLTGQTAL
jgi:uncharacterized protein (DUF1810 family)